MATYVKTALFLYVPDTAKLIEQMVNNSFDSSVIPVPLKEFVNNPEQHLQQVNHVVIAAPLNGIKSVVALAMGYKFSIGLIPVPGQKELQACYGLPENIEAAMEIALQEDAPIMDVIRCNNKILLFKATVGRLQLIDSSSNIHWAEAITNVFKSFIGLKLLPFQFSTGSGQEIETAASGSMIVQHQERTPASKLISHDSCLTGF